MTTVGISRIACYSSPLTLICLYVSVGSMPPTRTLMRACRSMVALPGPTGGGVSSLSKSKMSAYRHRQWGANAHCARAPRLPWPCGTSLSATLG